MRFIGMCRRLLSRIGLPVGRSLRLLLWDEFPEGRQYTDVMSGNVAANLAAQVDSLRHEVARVQARADALAVELAEVKAAAAAACPPLPIAANERFF